MKQSRKVWIILIVLFATLLCRAQTYNMVTVKGSQFFIGDKPYYYIGANYWYGGIVGNNTKGRQRIREELDFLLRRGVTNLRVLAGAEGTGKINGVDRVSPPLQPSKGIFDNNLLSGLDFLLLEMGKRNMKAIIYLSNNWEWSGGFLQYLNWNGLLRDSIMRRKLNWDEMRDYVSRFYECAPCRQQYAKQVALLVNRKNILTGRAYKDDATIMAWELANEPRPMRPAAAPQYIKWIGDAATYIKSIDKNHLVTTGCEGEMGTESMPLFESMHRNANIDYATIHIWPKNWSWFKDTAIGNNIEGIIAKTVAYIDKHAATLRAVGKPLVIEEFGLPRDGHAFTVTATTRWRDVFYGAIFNKLLSNVKQQGVIAGCNFWGFSGSGRPSGRQLFWEKGDDVLADPPQEEQGLNSVFNSDNSTWNIIEMFTTQIKKVNEAKNK